MVSHPAEFIAKIPDAHCAGYSIALYIFCLLCDKWLHACTVFQISVMRIDFDSFDFYFSAWFGGPGVPVSPVIDHL